MTEITTSSEAAEHDVHRDTDTTDSTPADSVPVESHAAEEEIADAQSTDASANIPSNVNVTATSIDDAVHPEPAQPTEIVVEVERHPQVAALHTLFPGFDDAVL
jgi:hypothetical protein